MTITVASGKGGTGKTTVAVNLSHALNHHTVNLIDCDVEEPNAHLFMHTQTSASFPVQIGKPGTVSDRCTKCGACVAACRFNALALVDGDVMIFSEICHGCGVCSYVCPVDAIEEAACTVGTLSVAESGNPKLIQGTLGIGETAAPIVVRSAKECIRDDLINIVDAPPGIGCAVVEAIRGSDVVLLVTEPTPFGLHDLELAVQLTAVLSAPAAILINRDDGNSGFIERFASQAGLPILGRIPFKRAYAEAYSEGRRLIEIDPDLRALFTQIYERIGEAVVSPYSRKHIPVRASIDEHVTNSHGLEVVVVSGKGGTGKTSIATCLCKLAAEGSGGITIADCDVDAANMHLVLNSSNDVCGSFKGMAKAFVDESLCTGCGACAEGCRFDAITPTETGNALTTSIYRVNPLDCEGCGLCSLICKEEAIQFEQKPAGVVITSDTRLGSMVHAELGIAEDNSGKLVSLVRNMARGQSLALNTSMTVADGPPGVGCPAISALSGADHALIVTEPSVSGLHDLKRIAALISDMNIPSSIIINKFDLNPRLAKAIEHMSRDIGAPVVGRVPFDHAVTDALNEGKSIVDYGETPAAIAVKTAWETLEAILAP